MSKALIEKAFENMPLEKVEKIPQKSFWITVNIHPNKTDQKPDTVKVVLEIDGEIDPIVDTVYDGDSHILNSRNLMPLLQASATWQREQLESKQTKIKCSNCGAEVSSYVPKDTVIRGYVECPECITKTNVATVTHDIYKQAREQLEAEVEKLRERCERQIWNLGGISTLLLGVSIDEFNTDYALPALTDTNEFVKKHKELEKENDRLKNAQHEHFEQIVTDLEMKNRELVTENEELKTMVNRNAGDVIYHQAEKIKLQDINATLKAQLEAKIKELEANQIKGRCKDCKHTEYCEWLASDGYGYCSEFEPTTDNKEGV